MIDKLLGAFDRFQQRHHLPGFIYAVIKKYGEDDAGYQAALLTYYGFLAIFPLLLIVTTLTSFLATSHPEWQDTIIKSMTDYFPVLGSQLSEHVHGLNKNGLALVIGILFTLYGARGIADSFRHGVNQIWQIPRVDREKFPKSLLKSMELIIVGGIGLVALQAFGGYLLGRELKNLDALYSSFAITLGLLFWIYLQAQVLYYSVEVSAVKAEKLWPRSIKGNLTAADRKAYARLASKERIISQEHINTSFDG
jgi:uncharacterized BrkB/YihY/UPF0761 family membrane protein